jgi:hypothetical protein
VDDRGDLHRPAARTGVRRHADDPRPAAEGPSLSPPTSAAPAAAPPPNRRLLPLTRSSDQHRDVFEHAVGHLGEVIGVDLGDAMGKLAMQIQDSGRSSVYEQPADSEQPAEDPHQQLQPSWGDINKYSTSG